MSARRNLRLIGSAGGEVNEQRISEVLDMVGLLARGDTQGRRLLARHEAASGHRQRAARPARRDHPRRAHERPRPAGHEGRARAGARARQERHDGAALVAPAARGRAGLQPGRDHQPGPHRDRGAGRHPAAARRGGQGDDRRPAEGLRDGARPVRRPGRELGRGLPRGARRRRGRARARAAAGRRRRRGARRGAGRRAGPRRLLPGAHAELRRRRRPRRAGAAARPAGRRRPAMGRRTPPAGRRTRG